MCRHGARSKDGYQRAGSDDSGAVELAWAGNTAEGGKVQAASATPVYSLEEEPEGDSGGGGAAAVDAEAAAEGADVAAERLRVLGGGAVADAVCVTHLRKEYAGSSQKVKHARLCTIVQSSGTVGTRNASEPPRQACCAHAAC